MRIVFLGTGTSTGVPVIGCGCRVCSSTDPRDKRLRQSLWLTEGESSLLIDASADLRTQALAHGICRVDYIAVTHPHADHILGLDDTRIFSYRLGRPLKVFGTRETLEGIRRSIWYCFEEGVPMGGGLPQLELVEIAGKFAAGPFELEPLAGDHGFQSVTGYRIGGLGYLTDCKRVPAATIEALHGVNTLAINALREAPEHPTHMVVKEAVDVIRQIGPKRSYLVHLGHEVGYSELRSKLPDDIQPAYDGLTLNL